MKDSQKLKIVANKDDCLEHPPSHPLNHAITTNFYLSSRHHAINLVQLTITPINLDLPVDFYDRAYRNYFENTFPSSFQQLVLVNNNL